MGGSCGVPPKQNDSDHVHRANRNNHTEGNSKQVKKNEIKKKENLFVDFEEIGDGKLIGEGIKQIPAYKCYLPYDQLEKLKYDFWNSKKPNPTYTILKACCETDHLTAQQLLLSEELSCLDGSLKCVISLRNPNMIFNIPNFCICDPIFEKDFKHFEKTKDIIKDQEYNLTICHVFENKENSIKISNKQTGLHLKQIYSKISNFSLEKYRLRFLYNGQEIKDDHPIYFYSIVNNSRIQVSIAEL